MKKIASLTLGLALFISCGGSEEVENEQGGSVETLPENPENIEISWGDGGGMMDLSTAITISFDSCTWEYRRNGYEKRLVFSATEEEVRDLYHVFVLNEFNLIEAKSEGEVYDRGGVGISLQADDEHYRVDNSGSYFIESEWADNWQNVSTAITEFVRKKQEDYYLRCNLIIDNSILSLEQPFNVGIDGVPIFNSDEDDFDLLYGEEGFKATLIPGLTEVDLSLFYKDSLNSYGGKMTQLWISEGFNFNSENKTATIYLDGEQLAIK